MSFQRQTKTEMVLGALQVPVGDMSRGHAFPMSTKVGVRHFVVDTRVVTTKRSENLAVLPIGMRSALFTDLTILRHKYGNV